MGELDEFQLSDDARERLKDIENLRKELAEGKSVQEILGFSNQTMQKFYIAAYHLFEHKRYLDAANAFLFLVTLNTHNADYWLGLGMALQLAHDYEGAIDAYEMGAICQVDNPIPYFYLAKCLFAIHDRESALLALDLAIEYANDKAEFAELKQQAKSARDLLLKG